VNVSITCAGEYVGLKEIDGGVCYAPAEFKKMAVQLESIAENVAQYQINSNEGYSAATGKILFRMQRTACESVFVAVTHLTLIAVQKALNAIVKVLKEAFGAALVAVL